MQLPVCWRYGQLVIAIAGALSAGAQAQAVSPTPEGYRLESMVMLSRHGVRPPTKMTEQLQQITPDKWPEWPVQLGYLTPRGGQLVTLMGDYWRQRLTQQQLLPAEGCPADNAVFVWADTDQRTLKTGEAFLAGLAPNCSIPVHHQPDVKSGDPLFNPLKEKICKLDEAKEHEAISQQAGVPLDQLDKPHTAAFNLLSKVLDFPNSSWCQTNAAGEACTFSSALPTRLSWDENAGKVIFTNGLELASTLTETFLLEQAEGMAQPGWGRITSPAQWQQLLSLHNSYFNLQYRTPYIARHQATPLLRVIGQALAPAAAGKQQGDITLPERLLFLAGHDTNIAGVAGALGLDWTLPGQPDNTPPGGELLFERWQKASDNSQWVRISMVYQTLDQMRDMTPLSLQQPAGEVPLALPGCAQQQRDGMCPLPVVQQLIQQQLEPDCELK